jgi:hypothetical protein
MSYVPTVYIYIFLCIYIYIYIYFCKRPTPQPDAIYIYIYTYRRKTYVKRQHPTFRNKRLTPLTRPPTWPSSASVVGAAALRLGLGSAELCWLGGQGIYISQSDDTPSSPPKNKNWTEAAPKRNRSKPILSNLGAAVQVGDHPEIETIRRMSAEKEIYIYIYNAWPIVRYIIFWQQPKEENPNVENHKNSAPCPGPRPGQG